MFSSITLIAAFALGPGSPTAHAAELELWSITDFGDDGALDGQDGWTAGWDEDPWVVYGGIAYSSTDEGTDGQTYGEGTALDNWIVRGDDGEDIRLSAEMFNEDDDALGVVLHRSADDTFYLLVRSGDDGPAPAGRVDEPSLILIRVEGGDGEVLASEATGQQSEEFSLSVSFDDGAIVASLDGQTLIEVDDPDPLPAGTAGFYAYNAGYDGGGSNTNAGATGITLYGLDEDDDGVVDDQDNCEETANPGQDDEDVDGIGNLCDDDYGENPGDSGGGDDTGDVGGPTDRPIKLSPGGCSCSSGPSTTSWGMALPLMGLLALRRRSPKPRRCPTS